MNKKNVPKIGKIKVGITADEVNETVSTDIFGTIKTNHFVTTKKEDKFYILTMTDIFSRYTEIEIFWDTKA